MTDIIVVILLSFNFIRGWFKGLLRSLLGPISLIIASIASYTYYLKTHDFTLSLVMGILGPFAVHITLAILLKIWHKTVGNGKGLSIFSRILGGGFCLLWSGSILVLMLMLITMVNLNFSWVNKMQTDVLNSRSYTLINRYTGDRLPSQANGMQAMANIFEDPEKLKSLESTKEYKAIMGNEKIKSLFKDQKVLKQIQNQEIMKLLSNPKITAILKDEELIKNFFALNKKILEESQAGNDK